MTKRVIADRVPHRAGVLGGGFMARVHTAAIRAAGGYVAAIATSSAASAERAAAALHIETTYADAADLIAAADIDVIHICTPNATHEAFARAALEAGKSVICEKPLATSPDHARQLVELAQAAGRVAAVPFVYRYHPMVREARARRGALGRVYAIRGAYLQDWLLTATDENWRVDQTHGGPSRAFADIGSHLCDLIEFVSGDRIVRVAAATTTVHPQRGGLAVDTEDAVAVAFETAAGAIGTLLVSQVAAGRKNHLTFEISGERESHVFDQENPELLWIGRRDGFRAVPRDAEHMDPAAAAYSIVPAGHPMGYQDAFNAFVHDAYASDAVAPIDGLPTFADGARAVRVTDAVLRSARDGGWVAVEQEQPALQTSGVKS